MDDIEYTIAELMGVPMEDWSERMERREMRAEEILAIEQWLIGNDIGAGRIGDQ